MGSVCEISADSRLEPLIQVLCELEGQRGVTPVLVVDPRLVLRDEFYISLCRQLIQRTGRHVRLDLLPDHRFACTRGGTGFWGRLLGTPWLPAPLASMILAPLRKLTVRRVASRLPADARLESTVAVSRPGGVLRELVVGLAGPRDELPRFAQEIILGVDPTPHHAC